MVRNGEIALSDVKRIVRRYWWIPTFMTLALGALGLAAALVLPKKYTSTTLVLVEQPAVSKKLIEPVITDDLNQIMASMKPKVFSRSRMEAIIEKFNLYPQQRATTHMEDLVEKLKSAVNVELLAPTAGSVDREPPGFNVSVTFDNPQLARQICQEITSAFMEQNGELRIKRTNDTTRFLSEQVDQAKAKLDDEDKKLAQFKAEHLVSMPENEQQNLALLGTMNSQLDATTQALSRAHEDKALNETLLNQQEANWKATQTGQQNPETQDQELAALQSQLSSLLTKYTPEHPDVIKLKAQIEDLKKRMAEAPPVKPSAASAQAAALREPASIQQLRTKIKQNDFAIVDLTKRQGQIQDQIRGIQGRLQASPVVEQQLKDLTRDHQTASDIYNDLLRKRENSVIAGDLEHHQEGANFIVLDAPSLPSSPSFPKKSVFLGGGLGAGLALSLGVLYLLALSDKALYTERDVEVCLKLPVLASVPSFDVQVSRHPQKIGGLPKRESVVASKA
jgi:polysaccharide chain length determinant protein (PEP-CTERM system associated)